MKKTILAILLAGGLSAQGVRLNDTTQIMHAEDADADANNLIAAQIANYRELHLSDETIMENFRDDGYRVLTDHAVPAAQDARNEDAGEHELQAAIAASLAGNGEHELRAALAASMAGNGDSKLDDSISAQGADLAFQIDTNTKKRKTNLEKSAFDDSSSQQDDQGEHELQAAIAASLAGNGESKLDASISAQGADLAFQIDTNTKKRKTNLEKSAFDDSSSQQDDQWKDELKLDAINALNKMQGVFSSIEQNSTPSGMPPSYIIEQMENYLKVYNDNENLFTAKEKKDLTFLSIFGDETVDITHGKVTYRLGNDSKTLKGFINALNVLATSPFQDDVTMYSSQINPYKEKRTLRTFCQKLEPLFNLNVDSFKSDQEKREKIEELIYTKGVLDNVTDTGPSCVLGKITDPEKAMQQSENDHGLALLLSLGHEDGHGVEVQLENVPVSSLHVGLGCKDKSNKLSTDYMDHLIDKAKKIPVRRDDSQQ